MTPRLMIDVNIDLHYQYGITVADTQTSPLAKCLKGQGARRNGCFRRLSYQSQLLIPTLIIDLVVTL